MMTEFYENGKDNHHEFLQASVVAIFGGLSEAFTLFITIILKLP